MSSRQQSSIKQTNCWASFSICAATVDLMRQVHFAKTSTIFLLFVLLAGIGLPGGLFRARATNAAANNSPNTRTQDQDDVLRISTDLVVVNVTVLDSNGKFVPHLKRTDFHIFEDGAEQKIASFSAEETPFAAAILLDTSG